MKKNRNKTIHTHRNYGRSDDYQKVYDFLIQHFQPENRDGNYLATAWEYMHGHPYLDTTSLGKIGIWEDGGRMVGVAHYESRLGEAFLDFHPEYRRLREEMLLYAEQNLCGVSSRDGRKYLLVFSSDLDEALTGLLKSRGYESFPDEDRPMTQFLIPNPFPPIPLPDGFHLTSLAEECDWAKLHRVMHRGFNHEGEPPAGEEELESRRRSFDTPTARRDLKIAVAAPSGDFVSFCGMFYEPRNRYAYVEPVATDPEYRRMGLGKAAVWEGIRRCGLSGATTAFVGSGQAFYYALGFRRVYTTRAWLKYWDK